MTKAVVRVRDRTMFMVRGITMFSSSMVRLELRLKTLVR